jgi:hypothetical protein
LIDNEGETTRAETLLHWEQEREDCHNSQGEATGYHVEDEATINYGEGETNDGELSARHYSGGIRGGEVPDGEDFVTLRVRSQARQVLTARPTGRRLGGNYTGDITNDVSRCNFDMIGWRQHRGHGHQPG